MIPEIIRRIDSVPAMLARNLPKAADYFYSYLAIQTVSHCVTVLFRLPESMWLCLARRRECTACKPIDWSLVYPVFANLMSICTLSSLVQVTELTRQIYLGLIFSVISPLILPVGLVMFIVFLITYSYQVIYVAESESQGNGLLYWEALHHVFVGIYTLNIFLLGLFFLRKAFGPASGNCSAFWSRLNPISCTKENSASHAFPYKAMTVSSLCRSQLDFSRNLKNFKDMLLPV
jgi:hypothetical protein